MSKHRHRWRDTTIEAGSVVTEQMCRGCGAYRHWIPQTKAKRSDWVEGEHPVTKPIRDKYQEKGI